MAFGTQKSFCVIPAHTIAETIGKDKCSALPMFHSITGCDTVSALYGKGKKTVVTALSRDDDFSYLDIFKNGRVTQKDRRTEHGGCAGKKIRLNLSFNHSIQA